VPFFSEHRGVTQPGGTYPTKVGSAVHRPPVVADRRDVAIALFITVDQGVAFSLDGGRRDRRGNPAFDVDVVASVATMGIPSRSRSRGRSGSTTT
jgi:hypothetical protein